MTDLKEGNEINIPTRYTGYEKPKYDLAKSISDLLFNTGITDSKLDDKVLMLDIIKDSLLNQFRKGLSSEEFIKDVISKMAGTGSLGR